MWRPDRTIYRHLPSAQTGEGADLYGAGNGAVRLVPASNTLVVHRGYLNRNELPSKGPGQIIAYSYDVAYAKDHSDFFSIEYSQTVRVSIAM